MKVRTWQATISSGLANFVSIHAPVKVRTGEADAQQELMSGFNPRTREGANVDSFTIANGTMSFNPRTREGANSL